MAIPAPRLQNALKNLANTLQLPREVRFANIVLEVVRLKHRLNNGQMSDGLDDEIVQLQLDTSRQLAYTLQDSLRLIQRIERMYGLNVRGLVENPAQQMNQELPRQMPWITVIFALLGLLISATFFS